MIGKGFWQKRYVSKHTGKEIDEGIDIANSVENALIPQHNSRNYYVRCADYVDNKYVLQNDEKVFSHYVSFNEDNTLPVYPNDMVNYIINITDANAMTLLSTGTVTFDGNITISGSVTPVFYPPLPGQRVEFNVGTNHFYLHKVDECVYEGTGYITGLTGIGVADGLYYMKMSYDTLHEITIIFAAV